MAMYRADYDAGETPATYQAAGIPQGWEMLLPLLGNSDAVLHCPDVPQDKIERIAHSADKPGLWCAYMWGTWQDNSPEAIVFGTWAHAYAERGDMFPIVQCWEHNFPRPDRPAATRTVLLLRLNGAVATLQEPLHGYSAWKF
jgi:hypothetical protein